MAFCMSAYFCPLHCKLHKFDLINKQTNKQTNKHTQVRMHAYTYKYAHEYSFMNQLHFLHHDHAISYNTFFRHI